MGYCGSLNFVAAILAHTKTKEKSCLVPFIDHCHVLMKWISDF